MRQPSYEERDEPARQPGFWQVPVGMLIESGDQWLDRQGRPHALPLEQVGRPVTAGAVVLRADRRRLSRVG